MKTALLQKGFPSYLFTKSQNATFSELDTRLKKALENTLRALPLTQSICMARFFLDTIPLHKEKYQPITEYVLCVLASSHSLACFDRLQALQAEDQLGAFFTFYQTFHIQDPLAALNQFTQSCSLEQKTHASSPKKIKSPSLPAQLPALSNALKELSETTQEALYTLINTLSKASLDSPHDLQLPIEWLLEAFVKILHAYGEEGVLALCQTLVAHPLPGNALLQTVPTILSRSCSPEIYTALFSLVEALAKGESLEEQTKVLSALHTSLTIPAPPRKKEDLSSLFERLRTIPFALNSTQIAEIANQYTDFQKLSEEKAQLSLEELRLQIRRIREKKEPYAQGASSLECIAIGKRALSLLFSTEPYPVQVLSLLALILFPQGAIAEVKTGEGKSLIIALFAFVCTLQNKTVHIISSSPSLAQRDQKKYAPFFQEWGIRTTVVCEKTRSYHQFQADILYGSASDFAFALMHEMLYYTPLFPEPLSSCPRFDCAIIDEVDNLTLDTCLNGSRLAYPTATSHDWVYAPLFHFVKKLCPHKGALMPDDVITQAKAFLEKEHKPLAESFTSEQIKSWLYAAHQALFQLEEKKDYIIQNGQILIIDAANTGRIQHGSRWS